MIRQQNFAAAIYLQWYIRLVSTISSLLWTILSS